LGDIVKLNLYLTDMTYFPRVNEIMKEYFSDPYPARAAVGVRSLPKGCMFEGDAIMVLTKSQ
jgi:enamine deaminase RidA (YjgF/YER057c/UK114 family)